jgi:hypothetical protein
MLPYLGDENEISILEENHSTVYGLGLFLLIFKATLDSHLETDGFTVQFTVVQLRICSPVSILLHCEQVSKKVRPH